MINTIALFGAWMAGAVGLALLAPGSVAGAGTDADRQPQTFGTVPQSWDQQPPVRIWVEEGTDLFYPGDPVRIRFRTVEDAYVAVFHLDTDGNLEMVLPSTAWDQAFVRGQRVHSVSGPADRFSLGRSSGIGYFYAVASPYPLDLRAVVGRTGGMVGRVVRGDPFWALEELTHLLVRDARFGGYGVDVFSYHVGGRHHYPSFACYDAFRRDLNDRFHYYPSCDRLRRLLVTSPYYYDTRRYRGDRTVYLRQLDDLAPRHGFKELPDRAAPPTRAVDPRDGVTRPDPRGRGAPATVRQAVERAVPRDEPAPARSRPTLERRAVPREAERPERQPESAPPRAAPAPAPQADPPPRRETRREAPPRGSERRADERDPPRSDE